MEEGIMNATQPGVICSPITFQNLEIFCSQTELPGTAVTPNDENVIVSREPYEDSYCYRLDTYQNNNWIRVNRYYPDGSIDETYVK